MASRFALQMTNLGFDRTLIDALTLAHRREGTGVVLGTHYCMFLNRRYSLQRIPKERTLLWDHISFCRTTYDQQKNVLGNYNYFDLHADVCWQYARGAEGGDHTTYTTPKWKQQARAFSDITLPESILL
jgi:hypothetical protein